MGLDVLTGGDGEDALKALQSAFQGRHRSDKSPNTLSSIEESLGHQLGQGGSNGRPTCFEFGSKAVFGGELTFGVVLAREDAVPEQIPYLAGDRGWSSDGVLGSRHLDKSGWSTLNIRRRPSDNIIYELLSEINPLCGLSSSADARHCAGRRPHLPASWRSGPRWTGCPVGLPTEGAPG